MPQLDLNTYVTNFFWSVIFVVIVYVFLLKMFLPRIFTIFFYRNALITRLLTKAITSRKRLDYYTSLYQFLESALNYSLTSIVLTKFKESLEYQNQSVFSSLFDLVVLETGIEQSFEIADKDSFELDPVLFY